MSFALVFAGFCSLLSEAPVRSKVVFSLARSVCPKLHDFSQLFDQVGIVAQITSPHEAPNIGHLLFSNATPGLSLTWREAGNAFSRLYH